MLDLERVIVLKSINNEPKIPLDIYSQNLNGTSFLVESSYLGLIDYDRSLEIQNDLWSKVYKDTSQSYLLAQEHPTVMTLGLRAHHLDLKQLIVGEWGYPIVKISRGGLATLHSPGQLVIYPIMNIRKLNLSVKDFVNLLFSTTQKTLNDYGITSHIDLCDQPGVYTSNGKIAFCGLQVKHGITLHGLSININNDIHLFGRIQSCGILNPKIDSLEKHNISTKVFDFYQKWIKNFYVIPIVKSNANCDLK